MLSRFMQHFISSSEYKYADMPLFYLCLSVEFDQNTFFSWALFKGVLMPAKSLFFFVCVSLKPPCKTKGQ